ncbi:MAG: phosphoribosyltransferase [Elusimicrobia bacterium]|nr:phosphoribosyltransferase [Elusimicrobiota bacterium]
MALFRDRREAAELLADRLRRYAGRKDAVVLAVPRGGLPIGAVVARELGLPLDVILTKKIGHPENPEFAIGAVSLGAEDVDEQAVAREGVSRAWIAAETARLRAVLRERARFYRGAAPPVPLAGRTAIVVDDGIATGRTLRAALAPLRREGVRRVVVAAPVAPPDAVRRLAEEADEVVVLDQPEDFAAIGQFYEDFSQVSDAEAAALLRGAGEAR